MKKSIYLISFLVVFSLAAQESTFEIQGKVSDIENRPLKGTNILIEGTSQGVKTDEGGNYTINAKMGDVLVFSYLGMHTKKVPITNRMDQLNVQLFAKVQELDEVQVKKRRTRTQKDLLAEYPTNKNLIKTSWGILDKNRASYSMRMVDGSEILPVGSDFLTSLRAHFPNMIIHRDTTPPQVYFPFPGRINDDNPPPAAIFDVDGFIFEQAPTWIIPDEIDRIAVMKRNGAIIRYGNAGAGGVIIINTKEKTRVEELGVERVYDNSGLVDSITQEANKALKYMKKTFDFMGNFQGVKSIEEAWQVYEDGLDKHSDLPAYYYETSKYFWDRWHHEEKALNILDAARNRFPDNVGLIKAVAYFTEEMGNYELALSHYLKVLNLRSRMAQSHRDVANAYNQTGSYKKALLRYARYEKGVELLDSIPFEPYGADLIMSVESNQIIKQRQKELKIDPEGMNKAFELSKTRVLLEWNTEDIEFEVQFIDPDDLYVLWNNYDRSDPEINLMQLKGYTSKQFFLDDALTGDWKLTLNYNYNDGQKMPAAMKATIFFDYGLPTQNHVIRVFPLYEAESSFQLMTINTVEKSVAN